MEKKPILSICIPTWNRWYSLQYTLKSIMDQDEFKSWDVEIVISDNASTDETEVEIWKLCKKYENIRYYRNKENIWWNPNLYKALSLWRGEYLWLMWSKTLISSWGIRNTINLIRKYNPDLIFNNVKEHDKFNHITNNFNEKDNIYYFKDTNKFFLHLWNQYLFDKKSFTYIGDLLSFISCICFSRQHYINSMQFIFDNELLNRQIKKDHFSQWYICFSVNSNSWIVLLNAAYLSNLKNIKNYYLVNYKLVKDFFLYSYYLRKTYFIRNVGFLRFIKKFRFNWIKWFRMWIIITILNKIWLYKPMSYIYRKYILKNWENTKWFIKFYYD